MAKRIYILSGGSKESKLFTKEQETLMKEDLKGKNNLVSIGAGKECEKNDDYFYGNEEILGTIKSFEFSDLTNFHLIDERTSWEEGAKLLKKADIIYLQGGDPFVQLEYIKRNGYDKILKEFNGIILGVSAGSMNLGKVSFYSKDEDYLETIFYEGLGLTNITIDPHFDINDIERVEEVKVNSKKHRIIGLPDYSAIIVGEDGTITKLGPSYIFENEKIVNQDQ